MPLEWLALDSRTLKLRCFKFQVHVHVSTFNSKFKRVCALFTVYSLQSVCFIQLSSAARLNNCQMPCLTLFQCNLQQRDSPTSKAKYNITIALTLSSPKQLTLRPTLPYNETVTKHRHPLGVQTADKAGWPQNIIVLISVSVLYLSAISISINIFKSSQGRHTTQANINYSTGYRLR